jgi:hypothetical protein
VPTILSCWTSFSFAAPVVASTLSPVSVTLNFRPPISSPYVTRFDGSAATDTTPSLTTSWATGTPNRADAISSSTRRASAATRRIGYPSVWSASDPPDPPWSTVTWVAPITQLVRSYGMSSSSAITWRNAVPVPWPRSVLPTKNVAVLS